MLGRMRRRKLVLGASGWSVFGVGSGTGRRNDEVLDFEGNDFRSALRSVIAEVRNHTRPLREIDRERDKYLVIKVFLTCWAVVAL